MCVDTLARVVSCSILCIDVLAQNAPPFFSGFYPYDIFFRDNNPLTFGPFADALFLFSLSTFSSSQHASPANHRFK